MGGSSAIVDVDFDLRNRRTATRLPNGGKFLLRLTHDKIMGCAKFGAVRAPRAGKSAATLPGTILRWSEIKPAGPKPNRSSGREKSSSNSLLIISDRSESIYI